jgi:hypothetical protein
MQYYQKEVTQLAKNTVLLILFCIAITISSGSKVLASTPELVGFEAQYHAYRFGKLLGYAKLHLQKVREDQYQLDYYSKVSAFFLSDKRAETSYFSYKDGQLIPQIYAYNRTGTGSKKSNNIEFDTVNKKIIINQGDPIIWNGQLDNQLYRLDLQLKLASGQDTFEYNILNNRGQLRHYKLRVLGKEQLDLPFGMLEGIKVRIERENSSRETIAWFSPQLNYQLVKLQQHKNGKEQGEIRLKSYKIQKVEVTPGS